MNILYISHENDLGGASRALIEIIDEMILRKNNVYILVISNNSSFTKEIRNRKITILPIKYFTIIQKKGKKNIVNKIKNFFKIEYNKLIALYISYKIKKYNINIIHSNSSVIDIGGWIAKFTKIKHYWHIRESIKKGLNADYIINENKHHKFMNDNSDNILLISEDLKKECSNYYDPDKLILFEDGLPKSYINPKKNIRIYNEFLILTVGNINRMKNQIDIIKAIEFLKYEKNYNNIKLLMAGGNEPKYFTYIKQYIKEHNLQNEVELLGYVDDMNKIRQKVNIEVLCSKHEGFGRVTVESMMSMNAIIGSDVKETNSIIQDNINGLLYNLGDYKMLSNKIEYLIRNPEEIKRLGNTAFGMCKEKYDLTKNIDELILMYERTILDKR